MIDFDLSEKSREASSFNLKEIATGVRGTGRSYIRTEPPPELF